MVSARGETLTLDAPVYVSASRDSLRLSDCSLSGAGGGLRLAGAVMPSGSIAANASLDSISLGSVLRFVPSPPPVLPVGSVTGDLSIGGSIAAPELEARVDLADFAYRGLNVRSATLAVNPMSDILLRIDSASRVRSCSTRSLRPK